MSALIESEPLQQQHLLLHGNWQDYKRFRDARGENYPALKITYNRGRLELMTVSNEHERYKKFIARMIELLSFATGGEIVCCGQMTIDREDLDRGFEADECYYVQNAKQMREIRKLNFDIDPPPDLAVEIEISRSLADRLDIYAAMRIPEIWRYDGEALCVLHLHKDGDYEEKNTSLAFPGLDLDVVRSILSEAWPSSEKQALRRFHSWIMKHMPMKSDGEQQSGS